MKCVLDDAKQHSKQPLASPIASALAKVVIKALITRRKAMARGRGRGSRTVRDDQTSKDVPSLEAVLSVLERTHADDTLPKLPDIRSRLRDRLVLLSSRAASCSLTTVNRMIRALEHKAFLAASRIDDDENGRLWFITNPELRALLRVNAEIEAKRLSRKYVLETIDTAEPASLLVSADSPSTGTKPTDLTTMERKLAAGGMSAGLISFAKDAVASVQEQSAGLLYKYQGHEGIRRHQHARTVVKKECSFAYESQGGEAGSVEGPRMLIEIEQRLKNRLAEDSDGLLKDYTEEHLLGHAFSLTGECVVWWSSPPTLPPESPTDGDSDE